MRRARARDVLPEFALVALFAMLSFYVPFPGLNFVLYASCIVLLGHIVWKMTRRDPYDLKELQDVHLRAELDQLEEMEEDQAGNVLCRYCKNVYPATYPACPVCSRKGG